MSDQVHQTEADLARFTAEFTFAGIQLKGILLQIAVFLKKNEGKEYNLNQLWTLQGLPLTVHRLLQVRKQSWQGILPNLQSSSRF
jgi:hypothetical protein